MAKGNKSEQTTAAVNETVNETPRISPESIMADMMAAIGPVLVLIARFNALKDALKAYDVQTAEAKKVYEDTLALITEQSKEQREALTALGREIVDVSNGLKPEHRAMITLPVTGKVEAAEAKTGSTGIKRPRTACPECSTPGNPVLKHESSTTCKTGIERRKYVQALKAAKAAKEAALAA